ncbi:hypothetical protein [Pseudomonas sp. S3_H06]
MMLFIWKKRRFFQKWEAPFFFASLMPKASATDSSSRYATAPPPSRASSLPHWAAVNIELMNTRDHLWEQSLLAMRPANPTSM